MLPEEACMPKSQLYLHIGLSKSGTTYLQRTLWASRDALDKSGVLYPGANAHSQRMAAWDLLGRRLRGVDQPSLPGAWQRLVESVTSWTGDKALVSDEFLVHARPRHLRRIQKDLPGQQLHVVVTVRDLGRTILSMWQQELASGNAWSLSEYVAAVRDPAAGPAKPAVRFWLRFDLERILATWQRIVPADRIHVVIVPPSGAPADLLATRFTQATGLDLRALTLPEAPINASMGAVEAEMLRRLNTSLAGQVNEKDYNYLVERLIRPSLTPSTGVRLPEEDISWITARASEQADMLRNGPYHVIGDPAELVPADSSPGDHEPDPVDEVAVAASSIAALHAVMVDYAKFRKKQARKLAANASLATKATSSVRAMTFGTRFAILNSADRSWAAAKVAQLYLWRVSRTR